MKPRLGRAHAVRWALFRALEAATTRRGPPRHFAPASAVPALAVFATTIGELNAVAPFLDAVRECRAPAPLWLLSDHAHYRESFLARFPDAQFLHIDHRSQTARAFFNQVPVAIFMLAEIPLLPHDAPARLPFAWLRAASRAGAAITAVNGWLYRQAPACRMDALEARLFSRDQLALFDLITVQDDATRESLIDAGACATHVHVAGNLKFDARASYANLPPLVPGRRLVVAGSMNNVDEYARVLDAFEEVRRARPDCALVLAPRHPQVRERTDRLCATLAQRGLHYQLRSSGMPPAARLDCLVLDTLGELVASYAQGVCAHVGINHNVLEPVLLGKPTTVSPGWEARYPGYPVYRALREAGLAREADTPAALAAHWLAALAGKHAPVRDALTTLQGAMTRTLALWRDAGWIAPANAR